MDIEFLESFGMTKTEARIFLEISRSKLAHIGTIIKKTGLHRGTVYNSINNLISKGFVNYIDKNDIREYSPNGIKIFENLVDNKKKELEENKEKIEGFFRELSVSSSEKDNQQVEVFTGKEAFKNLFFEVYETCKKENIEYLFQGNGGEMMEACGEAFYKYTQKLKKEMRLSCRVLLNKNTKQKTYSKYVCGNIKYLSVSYDSPASIWIYGDTVLIVLFRSEPLTSIKIKSNIVANSFRSSFENSWQAMDYIENSEDATETMVSSLKHSKKLDLLTKSYTVPHIFYPLNEKKFLAYRDYKSSQEATFPNNHAFILFKELKKASAKKVKIRYVVFLEGLNKFFKYIRDKFGQKEVGEVVKSIRRRITNENVEIRFSEGYNPTRITISQDMGILMLVSSEKFYGIRSHEKTTLETLNKIFTEYWDSSRPIEEYLSKISS